MVFYFPRKNTEPRKIDLKDPEAEKLYKELTKQKPIKLEPMGFIPFKVNFDLKLVPIPLPKNNSSKKKRAKRK